MELVLCVVQFDLANFSFGGVASRKTVLGKYQRKSGDIKCFRKSKYFLVDNREEFFNFESLLA